MATGQIGWQFMEVPKGIKELENTSEEFFSNVDILSEVAGLVRESIQNSLDEVHDKSKPARMVFTVGRQHPKVAAKYFHDLAPHLRKAELREVPDFNEPSTFLVVEDFNTLGLEGPLSSTAPSDEQKADKSLPYKFSYWFFEWKSGGSNKGDGNRGSWGVGKIVFPRASRIKSYLVLSVRRPEAAPDGGASIMFGHSILKYRTLDSKRYVPDCQWMVYDEGGFAVPTSDAAEQAEFSNDWNLVRKPHELGTSIVIPFCREEMKAKNLVQCIIRDYFISILGGQLECVVRDDLGNETVISKSTIEALIDELEGENLPKAARSAEEMKTLCSMYSAYEGGGTVKVHIAQDAKNPNDWSKVGLPEADADQFAQDFVSGKILQFTVETSVPESTDPKKAAGVDSFTVLLKKSLDTRSATVFCREGILIPAANTSSNLQNCISMVIVGSMKSAGSVDNSLANFLKFSEGPSHERWSATATNFKGRYRPAYRAEDAIRWVKSAAERCLRLIQGAENVEDDVTLSVYFPLTEDEGIHPGIRRVVLSGHRDPADPTKALLSWRADGFVPEGYELKMLAPTPMTVQTGMDASGSTSVDLDHGTDAVYKFQVTMKIGSETVLSNIVNIGPAGPPPPKKAKIEAQQTSTGFSISAVGSSKLPTNYQFQVKAAYRSRGSVSVKNWSAEDFELDKQMAKPMTKDLVVLESAENYCKFEVIGPNPYAEWRDFDPLRDLLVEVSEGK